MKPFSVLSKLFWFVFVPLLVLNQYHIICGYIQSLLENYYHDYIRITKFPFLMYGILITASLHSLCNFIGKKNQILTSAFEYFFNGIVTVTFKICGALASIAVMSIIDKNYTLLTTCGFIFLFSMLFLLSPLLLSLHIINSSRITETETLLPRGYKLAFFAFSGVTIIVSIIGLSPLVVASIS